MIQIYNLNHGKGPILQDQSTSLESSFLVSNAMQCKYANTIYAPDYLLSNSLCLCALLLCFCLCLNDLIECQSPNILTTQRRPHLCSQSITFILGVLNLLLDPLATHASDPVSAACRKTSHLVLDELQSSVHGHDSFSFLLLQQHRPHQLVNVRIVIQIRKFLPHLADVSATKAAL